MTNATNLVMGYYPGFVSYKLLNNEVYLYIFPISLSYIGRFTVHCLADKATDYKELTSLNIKPYQSILKRKLNSLIIK